MKKDRPLRVLCVASGGGHVEQMLVLAQALEGHRLTLVAYGYSNMADFAHPAIDHARYVKFCGWKGLAVVASLLVGFFQWVWIMLTERPDVIISTGAEVALAPIIVGKVLFRRRTVFVETASRKENPSRTGRLVYRFSDVFLVQSPALLAHYGPKARYAGRLL
jgi:UDP-N-acetylglucosamine:LPS N-acetylglucosamine transferase